MTKAKEQKEIKVIVRQGTKKDGTKFDAYKHVNEKGKLIDLHFRKDVETSKFNGLKKFTCKVDYCQLAENFEFPRYYVGGVDYDSIVDLFSE